MRRMISDDIIDVNGNEVIINKGLLVDNTGEVVVGKNLEVDGIIVSSNIPEAPSVAGTYTLTCTVDAEGKATFTWED